MRFDARFAAPIAGLAIVLISIVFVQLCATEDTPEVDPELLAPQPSPTEVATFTPGPSPTPAPATATPTRVVPPGAPDTGEGRDLVRVADLLDLEEALQTYFDENGSYPTTGGQTQSLCVYLDLDAACALGDFLEPLPNEDPLGDAPSNGYFYMSDGASYGLYAQRESDAVDPCPTVPEPLNMFDSLICIEGP